MNLGNRNISICRELTKKFEEIISGSISDVEDNLSRRVSLKGEIVIVLDGYDKSQEKDIDIESMLLTVLSTMSVSDAAKEVSKFTNLSRKEVYSMALNLKGKKNES